MENAYALAGRNIRAHRTKAGLTQQVLAERADLSTAFLSFLESGRKKGSLETYDRLARALDIPLAALFHAPARKAPRRQEELKLSLGGLTAGERRAIYRLVNSLRLKKARA